MDCGLLTTCNVIPILERNLLSLQQRMETASSSETMATSYQTAQYHNQEDHNLNFQCHENCLTPYNIHSTNYDERQDAIKNTTTFCKKLSFFVFYTYLLQMYAQYCTLFYVVHGYKRVSPKLKFIQRPKCVSINHYAITNKFQWQCMCSHWSADLQFLF